MKIHRLSQFDKKAIRSEERMRKNGSHVHKVMSIPLKPNEYLEFMTKCLDHAIRVDEPKELISKISNSINSYENVPENVDELLTLERRKEND